MAAGAVSAAAAASVPVAAFNVSPTRVTREQDAGRVPALDGLRGIASCWFSSGTEFFSFSRTPGYGRGY